MMLRKALKRAVCTALCVMQVMAVMLTCVPPAQAAVRPKNFLYAQAVKLAIAASPEISKKYNQILLKKMKYIEAVKTIKAKMKNITSFRWSPLLSFKFPQKLDMVEEYDLNIKPLTLQSEITTLQHEMNDLRYDVTAKVGILYVNIYIAQEKIAFTQERIRIAQDELKRNQTRLALGQASQNDVDTMTSSVTELESELSNIMREFESKKKEMSDLIKLDVTTNYIFVNPLKDMSISREYLKDITEYTLANDHLYYIAKMDAAVALLNLNAYESLMRSQYGSKMNSIQVYINTAKSGGEVDYNAFKIKYDEMLKAFDKPWDGKIRIIFFTFTMEWLKGQISGTRYIEDEMYAVYSACMEYAAAEKDRAKAEKDLIKQVEDQFELIVTTRNSLDTLNRTLDTVRDGLSRVIKLNELGKAEYSEVKDKQTEYEDVQLELVDTLASYNEMLMNYDRLTCGAITKLLTGAGLELDGGLGGTSYITGEGEEEPYYYIYNEVADLMFVFGLTIPEDFEPAITHYEIWYDGTQIGARTEADKQIRHLALDYGGGDMLTVRLYNESDYLEECDIDTTIPRDVLPLKGVKRTTPVQERKVGTYSVENTTMEGITTSKLVIKPNVAENIGFYKLQYGEGMIYTTETTPIDQPYTYLKLLIVSLEEVKVTFYDKDQQELYTARFDPGDQSVKTDAPKP